MRAAGLARVLVLATVVVLAAGSLCLGHGDGAAVGHLCASLVAMPVAPSLACSPGASGSVVPARATEHDLFLRDLPAPPPKS